MLQSVVQFLITSFVCINCGLFLYIFKRKTESSGSISPVVFIYSFFAGLSSLSLLSAWVSLLGPLNFKFLFFVLPIFFINFFYYRKVRITNNSFFKAKWFEKAFVFIAIILLFFLSSGKPSMEDTDLYHIQTVKWIQEHGTVQGLANLYLRLGIYSNWFHLIALFDFKLPNQNFLTVNNALSIWFFFYLICKIKSHSGQSSSTIKIFKAYYFLLLLYMFLEWDLIRSATSSTSYDFIVTCLSLMICNHLLESEIKRKIDATLQPFFLLILCSIPFFKLTGFLTIPLWIIYFISSENKKRIVVVTATTFFLFLVPFFIKNHIQTGYLIFPYKAFQLGNPYWAIPSNLIEKFTFYIQWGNRYLNQSIPSDISQFSYYKDWYLHLTLFDKFIVTCAPVSAVLILISDFRKRRFSYLFFGLILFSIFLWLMFSPDPRFSFGLLLCLVFFSISIYLHPYLNNAVYKLSIIAMSGVLCVYVFARGLESFSNTQMLQVKKIDQPRVRVISIDGLKFNIPEIIGNNWNPRCLNTNLPCIYHQNPYLHADSSNGKYFFFMTKPDSNFLINYYY